MWQKQLTQKHATAKRYSKNVCGCQTKNNCFKPAKALIWCSSKKKMAKHSKLFHMMISLFGRAI